MGFWNKEVLEEAVKCLSRHESVASAAEELSDKFDRNITRDAIRGAFLRYNLNNPSSYLKPVDDTFEPVELESGSKFYHRLANEYEGFTKNFGHLFEEEAEPDNRKVEKLDWTISFENKIYQFFYSDSWVELSFDHIAMACYLYSKQPPGRGLSARNVAGCLSNFEGLEWVNETFIKQVFRSIGFVHDMLPNPPHEKFSSIEEMIPSWNRKVDAIVSTDSHARSLKILRKHIEELQDELQKVYELQGLFEKAKSLKFHEFPEIFVPERRGIKGVIFGFSDMHAGKIVKQDKLSPLDNKYNIDILEQRVAKMCGHILEYAANNQPDFVVATWLGDLFEALLGNMRDMMHLDMKEFATEQWDAGISIIKFVTDRLLEYFACPIQVYVLGGNHDRLTSDRNGRTELLVNHLMVQYLKAFYKDEPRLQIIEANVIGSVRLPNNVNYIFQHGHIGPLKPTSSEKDFVNFVDLHGQPMTKRTLIQIGHWHSLCYRTYSRNGKVMFLPTIIGTDSFATEYLHKSNTAEFAFIETTANEDVLVGPFNVA